MPATVKAGELVAHGRHRRGGATPWASGRTRCNATSAPGLVLRRATAMAASSCDIASHQFEQFLFFSDALDARRAFRPASPIARTRERAGPAGCGRLHHRQRSSDTDRAISGSTGSRPTGLPTWGDGRLTILGTEGYIELRKYVDIAGRARGTITCSSSTAKGPCSTSIARASICHSAASSRRRAATAPRRPCRRQRCFNAMKTGADRPADGGTRNGVAAMSHDYRTSPSSAAASAAAISSRAICPMPTSSRCWRSATSTEERLDTARRGIRHRAPDRPISTICWPWTTSTSSTSARRRGAAPADGHGGAGGRQARHLRKAAGRLARAMSTRSSPQESGARAS